MYFLSQSKIAQVQHRFTGGDQAVPVLDDQRLPVFWTAALSTNVFVKQMRICNDPGIGGDDR
jgi:hypothetical protein